MTIDSDEFGERAAIREFDGGMSRDEAELAAAKDLDPSTTLGGQMHTSMAINELAAALAKAQGQMATAKKNQDNPFFKSKYADLAAIFDAIRGPLSTNGLAIVQGIEDGAVGVIITTRLLHSSGQWVESTMTLKPTKTDPQGVASAATYGRRIGLQALVGVAADVDDDGNEASKPSTKPAAAPVKTISVAQRDFNSWVKPYIDSGAITADDVKRLITEHKNDYANTLAVLKAALT